MWPSAIWLSWHPEFLFYWFWGPVLSLPLPCLSGCFFSVHLWQLHCRALEPPEVPSSLSSYSTPITPKVSFISLVLMVPDPKSGPASFWASRQWLTYSLVFSTQTSHTCLKACVLQHELQSSSTLPLHLSFEKASLVTRLPMPETPDLFQNSPFPYLS